MARLDSCRGASSRRTRDYRKRKISAEAKEIGSESARIYRASDLVVWWSTSGVALAQQAFQLCTATPWRWLDV